MKQITKIIMILFLFLTIIEQGKSQITSSKYEMVFDEANCWYNVYLHVLAGDAVTTQERVPFTSGVSLILPIESQGTVIESVSPTNSTWLNFSNSAAFPGGDEFKTFFNISQSNGIQHLYPEMHAGDVLLLFRFTTSVDVQGVKGMRAYNGALDDPGGGGAYGSSLVIGATDSHDGYLPTQFASTYAEATGPSVIYIDKETTISPATGGSWTQTNPAATNFDAASNIATGLAVGRSLYTFTPSNGGCATSLVLHVIPDTSTVEPVGIGEAVGDPAVEFGIYGTKDGILIPRMSTADRLCIANPAAGLLVYQVNDDKGYFYFTGQAWKRLSNTASEGSSSNPPSGQANFDEELVIKELMAKQEEMSLKYEEQAKVLKEMKEKLGIE